MIPSGDIGEVEFGSGRGLCGGWRYRAMECRHLVQERSVFCCLHWAEHSSEDTFGSNAGTLAFGRRVRMVPATSLRFCRVHVSRMSGCPCGAGETRPHAMQSIPRSILRYRWIRQQYCAKLVEIETMLPRIASVRPVSIENAARCKSVDFGLAGMVLDL